jgi:hypothetical protein
MYTKEMGEDSSGEGSKAIVWNETFGLLAGGNVRSEMLQIQLKQKVGTALGYDSNLRSGWNTHCWLSCLPSPSVSPTQRPWG